jgi:tetratricopeptide (TPR) repeat protein
MTDQPTATHQAHALYNQAAAVARDDLTTAIVLLEKAVDLLDERRDLTLFARISGYLAKLMHIDGDDAGALSRLTRVLSLASQPQLREGLRDSTAVFAVVQAHIYFVDFAADDAAVHVSKLLDVLDAAEEFLEATGFEHWRDGVLASRASIVFDLGRGEEALEMIREAIDLGTRNDDRAPGTTLATKRRKPLRFLRKLERFDEAEDCARQLLADPTIQGRDRLSVYNQLGHLLLETGGSVDVAIRLAEQGVELAESISLNAQCALLGLLFEALEADGQFERAARAAERHLELAEHRGVKGNRRAAYEDMAAAHINLGELDAAEGYLDKAEELAKRLDAATERTDRQDDVARVRRRLEAARREEDST